MEVDFVCPECRQANESELEGQQDSVKCSTCGKNYGSISQFLNNDKALQRCILCGCRDLYIQKDFSRKLGCSIAAIGAVLAPFTKLISLFVCAAIDLILYKILPWISICYRCHSIYRDFPTNPEHQPFNLGINDRYRSVAS